MSVGIKQAVGQVRLTNVAYVRLTRKGKKFEIACYRNKVANWRNKIETSIEEVLQIDTVFTNVSKGMLANSKDLMEAFGTSDHLTVCKEILDKGDVQVSEQERGILLENMFRDVASIVVEKSINPENNRPYTISIIQNAMKQIHFSVNEKRSSKSQALDVIRRLKDVMPIARASMALRVICNPEKFESVKKLLQSESGIVISGEEFLSGAGGANSCYVDVLVDPEVYKRLEQTLAAKIGEGCRVDVMQLRVASAAGSSASAGAGAGGGASADTDEEDEAAVAPAAAGAGAGAAVLSPILEQNSDADEDDEEVYGLAEKMSRKKLKKQQRKQQKHEAEEAEGVSLDSIALDVGPNEAEAASSTASTAATTGGNKKGKKAKRHEKEEMLERENRQQKLKERLEKESKAAEGVSASTSIASAGAGAGVGAESGTGSASAGISSNGGGGVSAAAAGGGGAKSCNTCTGVFPDAISYRNHFKSEWHVHNLKRKMKKLPIIESEEEFLKLSFEELDI